MSEEATAFPDLSGILSKVAENPQAMAMLSSLLGSVGSTEKDSAAKDTPASASEALPVSPKPVDAPEDATLPALAPLFKGKPGKNDDKRRLLLALKPFLSPERKQALNTLLLLLEGLSLLSAGKEPPCT